MRVAKIKRKLKVFLSRHRRHMLLGTVAMFGVTLGILATSYMLPSYIHYSFATDETCTLSPILFPRTPQTTSRDVLTFHYTQSVHVAGVTLYAGELCARFRQPPKAESKYVATTALSDISPLKKRFIILTPQYSSVSSVVTKKPLSLGNDLSFQLGAPDSTFIYVIRVNGHEAVCTKHVRQLSCPLAKLSLQYGQQYHAQVFSTFNTHDVQRVAQSTFKTISATTVTSSSVADGSIVYDTPQQFILKTDKSLVAVGSVTLSIVDSNGTEQPVQTSVSFSANVITLSTVQPLPRRATMRLAVSSVRAQDASGLATPYSVEFYVSGGPKVTSVTLPSYNAIASPIDVYFDQSLDPNQGVSQLTFQANGQTIPTSIGMVENRAIITPQTAYPVCAHLTLIIGKDIRNPYGISGDSAYTYAARARCHTTFSIGTSVQGRPITAYKIGSGSTILLFVGTMHGNEQNASELLNTWLNDLEANVDSIPPSRTIVVIPQINPDGVSADTRVNANNVDINRNFPAASWQSIVTEPDGTTGPYGGSNPLSEPESQALAGYIEQQHPAITVDYHSHAGVVQGNDAGDADDADALALQYALTSGYSEISSGDTGTEFDYSTTGSFEDWTNQALGLPEFLVELYSPTNDEFSWNRPAMWNLVKGSL